MSTKSTKARHKRFDGHGNVRIDGHPRWRLICCTCGAMSKALNTHNSPHALVKKFEQLGWEVGASKDVCPDCQRKTVASHVPMAKKTLNDMMMPMVRDDNGNAMHMNDLKAAAAKLEPEQARELIKTLRSTIPPQPKREKKVKPEKPDDPDYETWLNEQ